MTRTDRDHDLVLLGATGFVGRLTAEHLVASAPKDARIALAGRSPEKLRQLTARLGVDWPTVVVDSSDAVAVERLAASTGVVATTVGPYLSRGLPLATACARAGTSYADLTGESAFVSRSIAANHGIAGASGARIVHSCGFDSIPSDLGVGLSAEAAGGGALVEAIAQVRSIRGGVSGGTIDSLRQQLIAAQSDARLRRIISDPFALTPGPSVRLPAGSIPHGSSRDRATGRWQAPFVMGAFNRQVVQRSNYLTGWGYGQLLRYREVVDTLPGLRGRALAAAVDALPAVLGGALTFPPTRALLDRLLPAPGEGPSEATMDRGRFSIDVDVYPIEGQPMRTRVAAPYDPGYRGTAVMLGESALCLALDDLADHAGVLTPMVAMGQALAARLRAHRFTLDTSPLS
ncbi:Putative trans-acting enoyl reductase [Microbacterium lemovicicum]|uniref:Trans-acting enoyl reductase n=1 Tax=Microbacterium lemovicicum TaxID=1072463 RepID=A0A3S9WBZ9_9MICO|nr:saccharopine dehydrogenase NADP-binding domain-containing protein [Microbacterium lemovicicum]AZS37579.1 Putative trans-acting enoyl reductase [Microbacterium lemovicicum]